MCTLLRSGVQKAIANDPEVMLAIRIDALDLLVMEKTAASSGTNVEYRLALRRVPVLRSANDQQLSRRLRHILSFTSLAASITVTSLPTSRRLSDPPFEPTRQMAWQNSHDGAAAALSYLIDLQFLSLGLDLHHPGDLKHPKSGLASCIMHRGGVLLWVTLRTLLH